MCLQNQLELFIPPDRETPYRRQDPEVALILDVALRVARGPIEVDDPDIQGMCRIEFAEYRAVQPFIRPDGAEFRAAKHGPFPLGHLDPPHAANAHVVLPTEPAIGGSLATSQGRRKRAPSCPRPWRIRLARFGQKTEGYYRDTNYR